MTMDDSPQKANRENAEAERIKQLLRDAGCGVALTRLNRVRYTTKDGRECYFEVEELET
jgi:hypothetical protein